MDLAYEGNHSEQHTVDELMANVVRTAQAHFDPSVRNAKIEIDQIDFNLLVDEVVQVIETKLESHLSPGQKACLHMMEQLNKLEREDKPTDEWLTREQAARYLAMSRGTLNRMLEDKKLVIRKHQVGNRVKLLTEDVVRIKQDTLQQLDPIKSEMVREAEEMGLYDIPVKGP